MDDRKYTVALCQMIVTDDKDQNIILAQQIVRKAASAGAQVICLPEIWNAPYDMGRMHNYTEPSDGATAYYMSELAKENHVYLIGGSIPEKDSLNRFNTSLVFDPVGNCIAKHRKVHLFDVDVEGGPYYKESDVFRAGNSITVFDTEFGKMGLAICFDVRFPQMFKEMADQGCHLIFLPASFTETTGAAHWETLVRSRALDNQLYVAACATANNPDAKFKSWGHSIVTTPWGDYIGNATEKETIVYAEIDPDYCNKIRSEIPIGNAPAL